MTTLPLPMTAPTRDDHDETAVQDRPTILRRLLLDSAYNLSAFVLGLVGFVVVVTGLAVGLGLAIVWVGVVLLAGTVLFARGLAHVERLRLRSLQGRRAPSPHYASARPDAGVVRRLLTPLRDPQSWLDVVFALVAPVTGTVAFSLTVAWWSAGLGGLTYWFWQRWIPFDPDNVTLAELIGFGEGRDAESVLLLVLGVVALLTLPLVMRGAAVVHGSVAAVLLTSRAELQSEVRRVAGSRDAAHRAEADALRRLERDIHDGPQQRLVRLTMDIGRARRQLGADPERAGETLEAALLQARETVDELRSLSRGIAPPLLVDRGLAVALAELVNRSSVPVESAVDLPDQLPPQVETAVYFVVSEALTNVAKHSGAARAWVAVGRGDGDRIEVRVEDDGIGGAHPAKGLGLAGLRQRLEGVDGRLEVDSPAGGPTVLRAEIPVGPA